MASGGIRRTSSRVKVAATPASRWGGDAMSAGWPSWVSFPPTYSSAREPAPSKEKMRFHVVFKFC